MTFILPSAINLHERSANTNVDTIGTIGVTGLTLRTKPAGNLPLIKDSSRVQYASNATTVNGVTTLGPAQGVFFGTGAQNVIGNIDALTGNSRLLIWSVQFNAPNRIQVANVATGGVRLWIGSGSSPATNYREYFIGGNDTPFASAMAGPVTICVDLNSQSYDVENGTFDPEDVTTYGIGLVHESMSGTQFGDLHCHRVFLLEASKAITSGSFTSNLPFFLTNPIVAPNVFSSAKVTITVNGTMNDSLSVSIGPSAALSYTLTMADTTIADLAINFTDAWNASVDADVSLYDATSDATGLMTFTSKTAVNGEVLSVQSTTMGVDLTTVDSAGATGYVYVNVFSSSFDDAVVAVQGVDYQDKIGNWLTKIGKTFFIPSPFAFGDGVNPLSFTDNDVNVESPASNQVGQKNFRPESGTMAVFLRMRTSYAAGDFNYDNVYLGGTYTWGTAAPWDFDVDSTFATCTLGGTFTGMGDFVIGSSVTASGNFTLASGKVLKSKGANITGVTVNGDLDISGNTVTDFTSVIATGNVGFDTAGTYDFAGGKLGVFVNRAGGAAITINLAADVVHDDFNDPAVTNITVNQAARQLTLTGLQPNTEVRVYDLAGAVVGGVENSGTTLTVPIAVSAVNIIIHHIEYEWMNLTNVPTTVTVSIPIQQRFDRGYKT